MSYCRWSCDDYQCDVYCYADTYGGVVTHVAKTRPILLESLPPAVPFDAEHVEAWLARHTQVMAWIETAERKPIGLPHDGESFFDEDPASAANRLRGLQALGYNVPQSAIDTLVAEAAEQEQAQEYRQ